MLIAVVCAAMLVPFFVFLNPSIPQDLINFTLPSASVIFHTYTDKDDRAHISVVQGLYYSSTEELGSALMELGFKPTKVVAFKGDALVPRYQVTLPKSTDIGAFRKIKYICHQSVRIYKYKSNNEYGTMCSRCQTFGHAERNCNRAARCVKCTGAHLTAECDRKEEAPVRCCNCGGEHAASYRQCPQRRIYLVKERQERFQTRQSAPPQAPPVQIEHGERPRVNSVMTGNAPSPSGLQPQGLQPPTTRSTAGPPPLTGTQSGRQIFPGLRPTGPMPGGSKRVETDSAPLKTTEEPDSEEMSTHEIIKLIKIACQLKPLLRRSMSYEEQIITVFEFLSIHG
ncbi:unnamed protein product [Leptidea sinapis]|uniref:Pre-C2HC domain-containing protein n=1 Tax=Leptidea sinapis TaxID=189913 RepID=A0A5E4QWU5_9NEOP|nr:unnamed protein product [Leptidea sinapis]